MKSDASYARIERCLFKDKEAASKELSAREMEVKKRMMLCVSKLMDDPLLEDKEIVRYLEHGCSGFAEKVSKTQAYRDLAMLHRLVGNIQLSAKSWYRYMIVEGAKKAYDAAMQAGDFKGAAAALDKIGKYTRCDKEDDTFDFSKMVPPSFEPTDDVTVLEGIEPIPDLEAKRKQLRAYFRGEEVTEAEVVG